MIHKSYRIILLIIFTFTLPIFISCSPKIENMKKEIKTSPFQAKVISDDSSPIKQIPGRLKYKADLDKVAEFLRTGRLIEAENLIAEIIKKDPDNYKAYFYRGVLNQKNVEFAKALEDYGKAAELNPDDALTYAYKGRLFIVMSGNLKDAKVNFDRALSIDPNNREAQMGVGMMLMFTEDYGDAKIFFDKLIATIPDVNTPKNADLFQERGFAHYYVRDFKKSLEDFNKAIELDPLNLHMTTNYAGRAMTYYHLGQLDKAVEDVYRIKNTQEIVTLHSEYDVIVQVIYSRGDLDKAFRLCTLAYKAFPRLYADVRRYGEMLDNFGRTREAHELFKKAMTIEPHNIEAYERMGYSFMALGQQDRAESMFQKAVEMADEPESKRDAQIELADFLTAAEHYEEAEELLKNIVKSYKTGDSKDYALAYLGLCRIKCFTGKLQEAEKYLNLSEKIEPYSLTKDIQKADLLQKQGKNEEALALLEKCLPRRFLGEGDAYDVDLKMAEVLFSMGKKTEALSCLKRVFEKDYTSAGLIRLRYVMPKSTVFMKLKKDPEINEYLKAQKERIFRTYEMGGMKPEKLTD